MDMRALVDYLNETAYQYYTLGEPTISDAEWDKKYDELRRMEEETGERLPDSPTRRVGAQPLANFEQHTHLARLWSLDKAQSEAALREWAARADKLAGEAGGVCRRTQVRWADHQPHLRKRPAGGRGHARQRHRRRRDFAAGADHPLRAALHPLQGAHGGTRRVLHAHLRLQRLQQDGRGAA